jgi:hypothetical protein
VLFSLWDAGDYGNANWLPALPLIGETDAVANPGTASCKRNCNDCAVHQGSVADDGSTGTQCKVYIPAYSGQHLRVRMRRVGVAQTMVAYGQSWLGDTWEVSIQDVGTGELWLVGRQLLAGVSEGIRSISAFHELIGCTPCDAFNVSASLPPRSRAPPCLLRASHLALCP